MSPCTFWSGLILSTSSIALIAPWNVDVLRLRFTPVGSRLPGCHRTHGLSLSRGGRVGDLGPSYFAHYSSGCLAGRAARGSADLPGSGE